MQPLHKNLLPLPLSAARLTAPMETTLILLKPDCITGRKAGEVLGGSFQRIERLSYRCGCWFSEKVVLRKSQYLDLAARRQFQILQSGGDHFGADTRRVAGSHADADGRRNFHGVRF